jgi:hypothetical protein
LGFINHPRELWTHQITSYCGGSELYSQEDQIIELFNTVKYDIVSNNLGDLISMLRKYARKIQKEVTEESEVLLQKQEEPEYANRNDRRIKDEADHVDANATTF